MAEPFIGEIRAVGFNFAPRGWMICAGQLISIAQNTALFSILGTTYGGNGQTNFALPNLQGSAMISQGQGPGLSPYVLGEILGTPQVTLLITEMPLHSHTPDAKTTPGLADMHGTPVAGDFLSRYSPGVGPGLAYSPAPLASPVLMHPQMIGIAGGSLPHNNMQPYTSLLYVIAIEGIFPSRN